MLLDVKNVTKTYKRGKAEFNAVDNVSLSLSVGELVVINGQSGSGKSTLLAIIAGLLPLTSGNVILDDEELGSMSDKRLSELRNKKIGFIPQGHCLLDSFTVLDNLVLPFRLTKRGGDPYERAKQLLERVGIAHLAAQYPVQLSGGELRRAAIARGLINNPKLLIADEPTGDLDPENALNIFALFAEIAGDGSAVLVVTHEAQRPNGCDKRLIMSNGTLTIGE
jgi:putative ABC transport system ATP-binding protein